MRDICWRRYAEIGTGVLGWTPDAFWAATMPEFLTAVAGWKSARLPGGSFTPLARDEMEILAKQFPDH